MSDDVRPHRTAAAIKARREATQALAACVEQSLTAMRRAGVPITVAAIARDASVSRTFICQNPNARSLISAALRQDDTSLLASRDDHAANAEASWHRRALNAEDALREAGKRLSQQQANIGKLLGRIRDLETEWPEGSLARRRMRASSKRMVRCAASCKSLAQRLHV